MGTTSLCPVSVRSANRYKQIRSLIQTEAQPYRILLSIPNPTSAFLVQQANVGTEKILVQGLAIEAAKDWLAPTLTTMPSLTTWTPCVHWCARWRRTAAAASSSSAPRSGQRWRRRRSIECRSTRRSPRSFGWRDVSVARRADLRRRPTPRSAATSPCRRCRASPPRRSSP